MASEASVDESVTDDGKMIMFCVRSKTGYKKCEKCGLVEEVRVNELGTPIDFFRCPTDLHNKRDPYIQIKFPDEIGNLESIIEAIHNHLYDLLGHHTKFWFINSSGGEAYFMPMLRDIQKIILSGNGFSPRKIEELLYRSPCLEYASFFVHNEEHMELEENSKFYELDTVVVCKGRPLAADVLKHFKGRQAFLQGSLTTREVVQFLKTWILGDKFRNLEVITMDSGFNILEIRNSVDFKELNKEVVFPYIRKCGKFELSSGIPCEFKSNLYMVRESDGHVASVLIKIGSTASEFKILMGVWNMTETQFLEKLQVSIR